MSVEKLNSKSQSKIENNPFTQVSNLVINNIKDNDAFRIWVFLLSKSMDWMIIKEWTAKTCKVGKRKAIKIWSYLQRSNLLETICIKDEKGKIIKWDLHVLSGTKFDINVPFFDAQSKQSKLQKEVKKSTGAHIAPLDELAVDKSAKSAKNEHKNCTKTTGAKIHTVENVPTTKERLITKQKQKSFWGKKNAEKHSFAESMNQMACEARNIKEHEARKATEIEITPMPQELRKIILTLKGKRHE